MRLSRLTTCDRSCSDSALRSGPEGATTSFAVRMSRTESILQRDGPKAKPYQVKQVRGVILKHRLADDA